MSPRYLIIADILPTEDLRSRSLPPSPPRPIVFPVTTRRVPHRRSLCGRAISSSFHHGASCLPMFQLTMRTGSVTPRFRRSERAVYTETN